MEFIAGMYQRLALAHTAQGECGAREPGFLGEVHMQQAREFAHIQIRSLAAARGRHLPLQRAETGCFVVVRHRIVHVSLHELD